MAAYDVYILSEDDHIIICDDDEEAKEKAKQMVDSHAESFGKGLAGSRSSRRKNKPQLDTVRI
jgi:hypothetical protein